MVKVAQKIRDAAEGGQPFFSFEFFPPRTPDASAARPARPPAAPPAPRARPRPAGGARPRLLLLAGRAPRARSGRRARP